ncbi:patatin-like phospholipase family protein [Actinoplanes oblitus]|uniref:Patatin-like phospholipase family protein n=1 Tax=Actinoplanes oblitus TaxID=3040509 RepID=A0ABY8WBV9_9ACTN|nr:patatin-like phospholipase family protein [Actinoplanes oblitus]WIM93180.1 patatin-like phospholipase family protein [Actinoplanes oblitus]
MTRALVLGGGGVTGIAWHLGLLCGLQRAGVSLTSADTIIGTSAGSVVGTLVAAGIDLEAAVALQEVPAPHRSGGDGGAGGDNRGATGGDNRNGGSTGRWLAAMAVLADPSVPAQQARAQVGAMALAAGTPPEQSFLAQIEAILPVRDWPDRDLRITVVDTADGRDEVLTAESGVPLLSAVAASCAVPGLMSPITIGDRRYMDGGVRLGAGADLAAGAERVVVIAPLAMLSRDRIVTELASTGAAKTLLIEPDEATLEAFGGNFMDPSRRAPSVRAGLAQAEAIADAVRAVWS